MMEHFRPNGALAQGYYCSTCGAGGIAMIQNGHGPGKCEPRPKLVAALEHMNSENAVAPKMHANGAPLYADDGTLLDDKGNRSIFDDVDE